MKQIRLWMWALLWGACAQPELAEHAIVRSTLLPAEAEDLARILAFADSAICPQEASWSPCYRAWLLAPSPDTAKVSYASQTALYQSMASDLRYQIWVKGWQKQKGDSLAYQFYLPQARYLDFLEAFAKHEPEVASYLAELKAYGDIGPKLQQWLGENWESLDLTDPKIRVLLAIHGLSRNDQVQRRERLVGG